MYVGGLILDEKPWRFTPSVIEVAPEEPGVFVLWRDAEVLFIGFAGNLRHALLQHSNGSLDRHTRAATHYRWEAHQDAGGAFRQVMLAYHALHGRYPRINPSPVTGMPPQPE